MTSISIAQRIVAEKTVCVLLVRGTSPDDQPIFAYLAIRADNLEAFMIAQTKGVFYPEQFGTILASGEGDPPPEVRERMTREYGFNHEAMKDIADANKASELARNLTKFLPPS